MLNLKKRRKIKVSLSSDLVKSQAIFVFVDDTQKEKKELIKTLNASHKSLALMVSKLLEVGDFEGKWLQTSSSLFDMGAETKRVILIGTGHKTTYARSRARQLGLKMAEEVLKFKIQKASCFSFSPLMNEQEDYLQLKIGLSLGFYKYPKLTNTKEAKEGEQTFELALTNAPKKVASVTLEKTEALEEALYVCRFLQDTPPNMAHSDYISKTIMGLIDKKTIKATCFKKKDLKEMGMDALLSVGQGSAFDVQLLVLEYKPKTFHKTLALVGKGITMDTGGYSLKTPSTNQEGMKYDMSGAAVTLTSLMAIAAHNLPIHVYAVAPMCENMVDATSYRVSDVISSYSKKTIEVKNTDAEGRLILADALAYAAKDLKPDYIVEFSTLTGAMITTFGHVGAGIFAFDDKLKSFIAKALEDVGERGDFLPVWEEVVEETKGDISDLTNIGKTRGAAGSMFAAGFLNEFVDGKPFAHIDIAGVADSNQAIGYPNKMGSGYGVQLAYQIAKLISEKK
jgi:leucyl aminopeptidase